MPDASVLAAADGLTFRDFMTVALVVPQEYSFPDNWIYIHDPNVRVGRIQNFGSWSPYLIKEGRTCLGLEYFVFEGDDDWMMRDEDLVARGGRELEILRLSQADKVEAGYVVRMPKAYPVYDTGYQERLEKIRGFLGTIENLYCIGRNGQHRYNNQDHSMATALIAARHMSLGDQRDHWAVNEDAEYHEIAQTERQAPVTRAAA
jgi:UDP-galactopyranose mutase